MIWFMEMLIRIIYNLLWNVLMKAAAHFYQLDWFHIRPGPIDRLITASWRSLNPSCRLSVDGRSSILFYGYLSSDLPAPLCWSKTRPGTSSTSWRTRGTSRTAASSRSTAKSPSTGRTRDITTPTSPTETCGWVFCSSLVQLLLQLCLQTPWAVPQYESSDLSPGPAPARHVLSADSARRQQAVRWESLLGEAEFSSY